MQDELLNKTPNLTILAKPVKDLIYMEEKSENNSDEIKYKVLGVTLGNLSSYIIQLALLKLIILQLEIVESKFTVNQ